MIKVFYSFMQAWIDNLRAHYNAPSTGPVDMALYVFSVKHGLPGQVVRVTIITSK